MEGFEQGTCYNPPLHPKFSANIFLYTIAYIEYNISLHCVTATSHIVCGSLFICKIIFELISCNRFLCQLIKYWMWNQILNTILSWNLSLILRSLYQYYYYRKIIHLKNRQLNLKDNFRLRNIGTWFLWDLETIQEFIEQ